ncbi:MAG: ferredoxin [Bacillota bacterium]|jgi:ferredoxin
MPTLFRPSDVGHEEIYKAPEGKNNNAPRANCTLMVKIEIDRDGCIQCGVCYQDECPDIFGESDDGTSEIVEQYRVGGDLGKGEAPDSLADCANSAADACPVTVIIVTQ